VTIEASSAGCVALVTAGRFAAKGFVTGDVGVRAVTGGTGSPNVSCSGEVRMGLVRSGVVLDEVGVDPGGGVFAANGTPTGGLAGGAGWCGTAAGSVSSVSTGATNNAAGGFAARRLWRGVSFSISSERNGTS